MTAPNQQFIVTVMTRDRVGIVREVAGALAQMGGDLTDIRQQVLRGYLVMILFVTFPERVETEKIRMALTESWSDDKHPLEIIVKPLAEPPYVDGQDTADDAYVITVRGKDRIGFVASVAGFCASQQINILDLSTTVADKTYIMILLVDLSRCSSIKTLRDAIDQFNRDNDLNLLLQHH